MRLAAPLLVLALVAPSASAAGYCLPFILGHACVNAVTEVDVVGVDVILVSSPIFVPPDWRSAHAVASPGGAGAAVRGSGPATGGPLDVWVSYSEGGPQVDSYSCLHYPPYVQGSCMRTMQRVNSLLPPVPNTPHVPLLP